jgi:hypothetical protein
MNRDPLDALGWNPPTPSLRYETLGVPGKSFQQRRVLKARALVANVAAQTKPVQARKVES